MFLLQLNTSLLGDTQKNCSVFGGTPFESILHMDHLQAKTISTLFSRPAALVQIIEPAFAGWDGAAS